MESDRRPFALRQFLLLVLRREVAHIMVSVAPRVWLEPIMMFRSNLPDQSVESDGLHLISGRTRCFHEVNAPGVCLNIAVPVSGKALAAQRLIVPREVENGTIV